LACGHATSASRSAPARTARSTRSPTWDSSGDLFLCFATGNRLERPGAELTIPVEMLRQERIDALFYAVIEATEEAIANALVAAETMEGRDGRVAHALPHDLLREAMGIA
jgi:D-aminopeptidase